MAATQTNISIRITGTGTGPTYPAPRKATPGSRIGTLLATDPAPPVARRNARPRPTLSVARVAMNGTILAFVINTPFANPRAAPAARPTTTASHGFNPSYVI